MRTDNSPDARTSWLGAPLAAPPSLAGRKAGPPLPGLITVTGAGESTWPGRGRDCEAGKGKADRVAPLGRGRAVGVQPSDLSPAPPSPPNPGSLDPQPQNPGLSASSRPRSRGSERHSHLEGIPGSQPPSLDPGISAPNPHLPETPGPGSRALTLQIREATWGRRPGQDAGRWRGGAGIPVLLASSQV